MHIPSPLQCLLLVPLLLLVNQPYSHSQSVTREENYTTRLDALNLIRDSLPDFFNTLYSKFGKKNEDIPFSLYDHLFKSREVKIYNDLNENDPEDEESLIKDVHIYIEDLRVVYDSVEYHHEISNISDVCYNEGEYFIVVQYTRSLRHRMINTSEWQTMEPLKRDAYIDLQKTETGNWLLRIKSIKPEDPDLSQKLTALRAG